jgi:AraC-like DNA-binding protein/mannose-6-phosphate isomerase-like protein (cupin superfamily)
MKIADINRNTERIVSLYESKDRVCWYQVKRYYAINFDYFDMEPHIHSEFEIMYVVSGRCNIYSWTTNGERVEWTLREGEYVVVDCNTSHQLEVIKGTKCRILNLEIEIRPQEEMINLLQIREYSKSVQDFLDSPIPIYRGYDDSGNLHTIVTELHKQLQNITEEIEHRVVQNLLLAQLLIELSRQREKKYKPENGSKYVRKALAYLLVNFDQDIKVKEIACKVGISTAYLQRIFKEQTGTTLIAKMNEFRIEKAKILLETSCMPITDIAISVGFNNRQHFTFMFLSITGCSPAVYRKKKGNYSIWKMVE